MVAPLPDPYAQLGYREKTPLRSTQAYPEKQYNYTLWRLCTPDLYFRKIRVVRNASSVSGRMHSLIVVVYLVRESGKVRSPNDR